MWNRERGEKMHCIGRAAPVLEINTLATNNSITTCAQYGEYALLHRYCGLQAMRGDSARPQT